MYRLWFTVNLLWITATHPTQGDNSCAIYEAPFLPRVYKQTPPPWLLGPAMYSSYGAMHIPKIYYGLLSGIQRCICSRVE